MGGSRRGKGYDGGGKGGPQKAGEAKGSKKEKEEHAKLLKEHVVPTNFPVLGLDCRKAFEALTPQEKRYTHYMSKAAWEGSKIIALQISPEAPQLINLFQAMFRDELAFTQAVVNAKLSKTELEQLLGYVVMVYGNMSNFRNFGDKKYLPAISEEAFGRVCSELGLGGEWRKIAKQVYAIDKRSQQLGLESEGLSTYYSSNMKKEDCEVVGRWMASKDLSPYNTRLFKMADGVLELRIASVLRNSEPGCKDDEVAPLVGAHEFEGRKIILSRGDYSPVLDNVCGYLRQAQEFAANQKQRDAIEGYVDSFKTGSINAHKRGSTSWVKDQGPVVETYIGFIENYRDPYGVRGEWEGFVAVVDKELSKTFGELVDNAEKILPKMPWEKIFHKPFHRPDFTSLNVVNFSVSGLPIGINIPNYDDVRAETGHKNVELSNVVSARSSTDKANFVADKDQAIVKKHNVDAMKLQVGLHELLGHGSGACFDLDADGKLKFESELPADVPPGGYKQGESFSTKFGQLSSSYEECRAECAAIYLAVVEEATKAFNLTGEEADDVVYVGWLLMAVSGVKSMEAYSPELRKWQQAHSHARYIILRAMIAAGEGFVKLERSVDSQKRPDVTVHMDRAKIRSVGVPAIGKLLRGIQVNRATGNMEGMLKVVGEFEKVEGEWLKVREAALAQKKPRPVFVQPLTEIDAKGDVQLREFSADRFGMIRSFQARFPEPLADLIALTEAERHHHTGYQGAPRLASVVKE